MIDKRFGTILTSALLLVMIGVVYIPMVTAAIPGDVDGNGVITDFELLTLIDQWEAGEVTDSDLLTVISVWSGEWCLIQIGNADVVFTVPKNTGVAKLYFTPNTMWDVFGKSCWYAACIINIAKQEGYVVVKSQSNMAYEIRVHIAGYIAGERVHSNPIDIELYTGCWMKPDDWVIPWEIIEVPCFP